VAKVVITTRVMVVSTNDVVIFEASAARSALFAVGVEVEVIIANTVRNIFADVVVFVEVSASWVVAGPESKVSELLVFSSWAEQTSFRVDRTEVPAIQNHNRRRLHKRLRLWE